MFERLTIGKPKMYQETQTGYCLLKIPQDILDTARLTIDELKREMAVFLYAQGRISVGKAHELAEMSLWEFRQLLAFQSVSPHYDVADFEEDIATLHELGRL